MTPEQKAAKAKAAAKERAKLIAGMTAYEKARVMRGLATKSPEAKAAAKAAYKADKLTTGQRIAESRRSESKITAAMHLRQAQKLLAEAKKAQAAAKAAAAAEKAASRKPRGGRGGGGMLGGGSSITRQPR